MSHLKRISQASYKIQKITVFGDLFLSQLNQKERNSYGNIIILS